ncbi:MAG: DUF349 domain-containing protein [Anditalea sp.]
MEHPYGYIVENKLYLKGFIDQEDRIIGEVKEDEESTIKYFEDRFQVVKEKVENLKKDIAENQNKGSFLMKLIHLRDSLMHYDALGDFVPLVGELNQLENYLEEIIKANRKRNLEIKKALILEAEALMNSTDWKKTSEEFKNLKLRWIKTGPVEKELEEEVEQPFHAAIDTFFENRKNYFEGLALQAEENIKVYEDLLLQARQAYELSDVKLAFEISKKIQKQWKESGRVPAEKRQPLWDEFSKLNNRIFSKFKRAAQNTPTISPGNLLRKLERMNNEMKALADSPYSPETLAAAKRLQEEWKKLPKRKPKEAQQSSRSFIFSMDIVFERSFLNRLVQSKYQDFDQKEAKEQNQIRTSLLKDLINRDQREWETIKENSEKFRTHGDDFETILQRKMSAYKRKVEVKNHILTELLNK